MNQLEQQNIGNFEDAKSEQKSKISNDDQTEVQTEKLSAGSGENLEYETEKKKYLEEYLKEKTAVLKEIKLKYKK